MADAASVKSIQDFLSQVLGLSPAALWQEALRVVFLPTVADRIWLADTQWWQETCEAIEGGRVSEADVYGAAWQLVFDGMLQILGYHDSDVDWLSESLGYTEAQIAEHQRDSAELRTLLARLAEQTRGRAEAPLRIAHCVRDLAYGDASRAGDLKAMVESDDPTYREIFERCYWRPTDADRAREAR